MRANDNKPSNANTALYFLIVALIITYFTPPSVDKIIFFVMFIVFSLKTLAISQKTSLKNIPLDYWVTAGILLVASIIGHKVDLDLSEAL